MPKFYLMSSLRVSEVEALLSGDLGAWKVQGFGFLKFSVPLSLGLRSGVPVFEICLGCSYNSPFVVIRRPASGTMNDFSYLIPKSHCCLDSVKLKPSALCRVQGSGFWLASGAGTS